MHRESFEQLLAVKLLVFAAFFAYTGVIISMQLVEFPRNKYMHLTGNDKLN